MHELSIAMSLVEAALEEAARHRIERIDAVYLQLGTLSGVVREALEHSYEIAVLDTPLAGSRLVIEEVVAEIECDTCGGPRLTESLQLFACAVCGTPGKRLLRGKELQIVGFEVGE